MPKVKLYTIYERKDGTYAHPGQTISVSREERDVLVTGHFAQSEPDADDFDDPTVPSPVVETTAIDAADENAAERTGRTRRSRG
jgi:hypothetical protein